MVVGSGGLFGGTQTGKTAEMKSVLFTVEYSELRKIRWGCRVRASLVVRDDVQHIAD